MSFSDTIKEWVSIDNEIKDLNIQLKQKREQRNNVLESILEYKNRNNLGGKMIKYNNETLRFTTNRQYQSITYEFIRTCLNELIKDEEQVGLIINYMKEKRNYKNVEDIKRFYT